MNSKQRCAAGLLATAVALGGLAEPALAQNSLLPWSRQPDSTRSTPVLGSGTPVVQAGTLSPAQARWAEINVELALLADEMTFPGPLTARVQGMQLELSGAVSCETARQRALQLARMHGTLPVRDAVKIQAGLAVKPISQTRTPLTVAAIQLLNERLKERAHGLETFSPTEGKLVVRGPVSCFEEKLRISQVLRETPGCKCVLNETTVTPVAYQSGTWQKVSFDGKLTVAATGMPADSPALAGNSTQGKGPQARTTPTIQPAGYQPTATPGTVVQAATPAQPSYGDNRLIPVPTDGGYTTVQPTPTPAPAPAPARPFGGLFSRLFSFGSKGDISQPTQTYPYPNNQVVTQPMTPAGTSGAIRPATSTPGTTQQPHVVNGVVLFEGQPVNPNPRTLTASQADLKRRVQSATAGKARDVDLIVGADGKLVIKFTVSSHETAKELTAKIVDFPEMKSTNVKLEVAIMTP